MAAYFSGDFKAFNFPIAFEGTEFQIKVWNYLMGINVGDTASYSDGAQALQSPNAVGAIGSANGKNKIMIGVPCHRVISKSGQLHGYVGGVERKKWLLSHEA